MFRKTQLWSPDSCGCIFHESYDDDNHDEPKKLEEAVLVCPDHATLASGNEAYKAAQTEARLKEDIIKYLLENNALPMSIVSYQSYYDEEKQTVTNTGHLHKTVLYKYYFKNPERTLVFSLEGIDVKGNVIRFSNEQKSTIMTVLNSMVGNSKCVLKDQITVNRDEDYKRAVDIRNTRNENYVDTTAKFRAPTQTEQEKLTLKKKVKQLFTVD